MDKKGNMALGYSVVNGVDVFPGIRYTGRLSRRSARPDDSGRKHDHQRLRRADDHELPLGRLHGHEQSIPRDDCTFWYVNEYYTLAGQAFQSSRLADPNRQFQVAWVSVALLEHSQRKNSPNNA